MKKIFFFALVFCGVSCYSQDAVNDNNLKFSVSSGIGRSTFKSNPSSPNSFSTPELRLGLNLVKPINHLISIKTGLAGGLKMKSEALNKPGQAFVIGPPYSDLDELASNRNHYFLEVPILAQVNLTNKIGLDIGMNYRFFVPNNNNVDALTNRGDIGLAGGLSYGITNRINVGIQYYHGLTKIYSSSGLISSQEFSFEARNEFVQLKLDYFLKNTRK